jgi:hypothetical protein
MKKRGCMGNTGIYSWIVFTVAILVLSGAVTAQTQVNWSRMFANNTCWTNNHNEIPFVLEFGGNNTYILNGNATGGTWTVRKDHLFLKSAYGDTRRYKLKFINADTIEIREGGEGAIHERLRKCNFQ